MSNQSIKKQTARIFFLLNCSALVLSLLIVFLSTHIRLGEAGLGCAPWPECYAPLSFADGVKGLAIPDSEYKIFRSMHRSIASLLGINVLAILLLALRHRKHISPILPLLMFMVVLFLSILGIATPSRSFPIVTLGNILGGITLAGLIWRQLKQKPARKNASVPLLLRVLTAAIMIQLISGAWASANYTGSACPTLLTCTHSENISGHLLNSFNIARKLNLDTNQHLLIDETSSIIQITHRLLAILVLLLSILAFRSIRRHQPLMLKPMLAVVLLCLAEFMLGLVNVLTDMPLWTNTLHNLLAACLLFAIINVTTRFRYENDKQD